MEPPAEHRTGTTRMRHREDDALVFPRRPNENHALDVDSGRQARVFSDNLISGGEVNMYNNKGTSNNARLYVIGGFCCFLFLLATVSIYTSLNNEDAMEVRAIDDTKIENIEAIPDEIIEETADDELESEDDCVGEGDDGNTMYGLFKKPAIVEEVIIVTEIDLEGDGAAETEDESVVGEADEISDATVKKDDKEVFVMEVNGVAFEIGITSDGDFDLPEGLILNPKVREHWVLIEKTLGLNDYEDDGEDESAGDGPEKALEAPLSVEDSKIEDVDQTEVSGNEQPVRMPEGLMFEAPPVNGEHEHGTGCDPISVDVGNSVAELAAGDKVLEENQDK